MPKRHGNLFTTCFTLHSLHQAYLKASKGKRHKPQVQEFAQDLGYNLRKLKREIVEGTYEPRPYKTFEVYEPKQRTIYAPHFRDQVVQHAIYKVIYPIYDRTFIHDSYGSRKFKGTHRASDRAQEFLRKSKETSYTLQLDIRRFFYSICRKRLYQLLQRKVKDKRLLKVMKQFLKYPEPKGIPIGCLLSQLYALVYLNPLDHYVKRDLKARMYVRYVDDFILFGLTKCEAQKAKAKIEKWLKSNLSLSLSRWTLQRTRRGVNFVGFRTWRTHRLLRKHSLHTFSKALKENRVRSIISIIGNARWTSSRKWLERRAVSSGYLSLIRSLSVDTR